MTDHNLYLGLVAENGSMFNSVDPDKIQCFVKSHLG